MRETKNILIAGVGGQGSLLASKILGNLFGAAGLAVKVSEVHGMSQRGGSVVTYVRAGRDVASPLIAPGEVDILLALEELEALRWLYALTPDGVVVASTQKILPMPVISGREAYPSDIRARLSAAHKVIMLDAQAVALAAQNPRGANVALLGAMSWMLPYGVEDWEQALAASVKPALLERNLAVFAQGRAAGQENTVQGGQGAI